MKYIVVDMEMNPVDRKFAEERRVCRSEIIEIGAVVLDERYTVIGEFKSLVCPEFNDQIQKKYETLTGITTDMVVGAPKFAQALEMFSSWCLGYGADFEVYAWSESDLKQIQAEMTLKNIHSESMDKLATRWYDFQEEYRVKLGLERIMSLEKALDYANVSFEGRQHDALCDARNTAELFAIVRDDKRCKAALESVMEALKPKKICGPLGDMFDFSGLLAACS